jgi:hypothetical protein
MHSYRAYLLDRHGHIFNRIDLSVDMTPLKRHAELLTDMYAVELWDCGRKVALFLPSVKH